MWRKKLDIHEHLQPGGSGCYVLVRMSFLIPQCFWEADQEISCSGTTLQKHPFFPSNIRLESLSEFWCYWCEAIAPPWPPSQCHYPTHSNLNGNWSLLSCRWSIKFTGTKPTEFLLYLAELVIWIYSNCYLVIMVKSATPREQGHCSIRLELNAFSNYLFLQTVLQSVLCQCHSFKYKYSLSRLGRWI